MTDYISAYSQSGNIFVPRMFQGFPEIKEALIANKMQAGFVVGTLGSAVANLARTLAHPWVLALGEGKNSIQGPCRVGT